MSAVTLTTAFTPSPSCLASNNFWAGQQGNSSKDLYIQLGPPLDQAPACYPDSYAPAADLYFLSSSCPSGYTAACASTTATAAVTRTIQVCCPSAFTFLCGNEQPDALAQYQQSPWLSSFGCWSSIPSTQAFTSLSVATSESVETIATQATGIVGAFAIQVLAEVGDGPSATAPPELPS
ncbi:hypothetical protein GQ53DRAFT_772248 [Thozetella sp. PMI_491]|nr:hypothetical protein GQ53DRAFT_772248 [Thozetella sp. PMI_491]